MGLQKLNALHQRYDGPIPEEARRKAMDEPDEIEPRKIPNESSLISITLHSVAEIIIEHETKPFGEDTEGIARIYFVSDEGTVALQVSAFAPLTEKFQNTGVPVVSVTYKNPDDEV